MALTDSLVGYWNLSEASGQRNDSHTNALHLDDGNTVTGTTGPGAHNASLFTRANAENLSRVDDALLDMNGKDFTIAGWVKFTTLVDFEGLAAYGVSTGNIRGWQLHLDTAVSGDAVMHPFSDGSSPAGGAASTNFGTMATGTWYFVLGQVTVAGLAGIQVNNSTINTSSRSTPFSAASQTFGFGWRETPTAGHNLDGALAMWGLWERLLTTDEKVLLYNGGNGLNYAEILETLATNIMGQIIM